MSNLRLAASFALAALLLPSAASACMWDYDTLLQERSRFPDTLELITGKFLRHSKEFYEWRIKDRLEKLQANPDNLAWHDDLAVAYDKTGQHQKAIDTMLAKDKKRPGLYETEANLGTFYIHAGQLEKGLKHIDNALRINPDAHFGREKYQRLFVQFVLEQRKSKPTSNAVEATSQTNFEGFLCHAEKTPVLTEQSTKAAIKGILGMMRFGNYDSPPLLAALASLLARQHSSNPEEDAKRLAARAYLKASYGTSDEAGKLAHREAARKILQLQTRNPATSDPLTLEELETSFCDELAEAEAWYEELHQKELRWIKEAKDPEKEFAELYRAEPTVSPSKAEEADLKRTLTEQYISRLMVAFFAGILLTLLILLATSYWRGVMTGRSFALGLAAIAAGGVLLALAVTIAMYTMGQSDWRLRPTTAADNVKRLSNALLAYEDANGAFPPAAVQDNNGKALLSWRVLILPYLEREGRAPPGLFQKFKLDEPWDGPDNLALLEQMPEVFQPTIVKSWEPRYTTTYQAFVGKGAAFEADRGVKRAEFRDGPQYTLLIAEASRPVPWSKPEDLLYVPGGPLPPLGHDFWSGFYAALANGQILYLRLDTPPATLGALITRDAGDDPGTDW